MKMKSVLLLGVGALSLSACVNLPFSSYGIEEKDTPASSLQQARDFILSRKAALALNFYENAWRSENTNPEYAYFYSAIAFQENALTDRFGNELEKLQPNHVLRGMRDIQVNHIIPLLSKLAPSIQVLAPAFDKKFEPIMLGAKRVYEGDEPTMMVFDRASMLDYATNLRMTSLGLDIARRIVLDNVEVLDQKLDEIKAEIYKKNPACKKNERAQLKCVNKILTAGRDLLMNSPDPQIRAVFTVAGPEYIRSGYESFKQVLLELQSELGQRKPLGEHQDYLAGDRPWSTEGECAVGRCTIALDHGVSIVMDVPGFFRNFPSDLRQLMPKKFVYDDRKSAEELIRDLEFYDPTLAGLFPNGDLIEKASQSRSAEAVLMYAVLTSAWAMDFDMKDSPAKP